MSAPDPTATPLDLAALDAQLTIIAGAAGNAGHGGHPVGSIGQPLEGYIELRAFAPSDRNVRATQVWVDARDPGRTQKVADAIVRLRGTLSAYIGCAVRVRRRGRVDDVIHSRCLWVDCDSSQSTSRLLEFAPAPSMVVASGRRDHLHAYWRLRGQLLASSVRTANRRLALALEADLAPTHAAAILRPIGSVNHRNHSVSGCVHVDRRACYDLEHVVGRLPDGPVPERAIGSASAIAATGRGARVAIDGLLTRIRNAPAGTSRGYNATLYWAACRCVEHVARGELNPAFALDELSAVGLQVGLGERATRATLRSAGLS